jgi:hypothetical protein
MMKNVRCMKYEKKKPKSREASGVASSVDPSFLRELRDKMADAKGAAEDAKATVDEGKKKPADAKNAASDAERDGTSAHDAASDAKNAVDSVESTIKDMFKFRVARGAICGQGRGMKKWQPALDQTVVEFVANGR